MDQEAKLKDLLNETKRKKVLADLEQAREKQFKDKENRLLDRAKAEREEYLRIIECQQRDELKERQIEEQKRAAFVNHKHELQL